MQLRIECRLVLRNDLKTNSIADLPLIHNLVDFGLPFVDCWCLQDLTCALAPLLYKFSGSPLSAAQQR